MHASSLENMWRCYRRYVAGGPLEQRAETIVLDVGGTDINGSYREVFPNPPFRYWVADIAPGPDVDIVLGDPYRIPLPECSVDIVISDQALEHVEFFWRTFAEMVYCVVLPSSGPIHRYPVDCYRFLPDAYDALAKHAGCTRVESWLDERGPWCDLVGVFRRADAAPLTEATQSRVPVSLGWSGSPGTAEEEVVTGAVSNHEILALLHREHEPSHYLEIGVRHGASRALARGPATGVDPAPAFDRDLPPTTRVVALTSDEFFAELSSGITRFVLYRRDGPFRMLRDFMNFERRAAPGAIAVIDDIFPNHLAQAERERRTCQDRKCLAACRGVGALSARPLPVAPRRSSCRAPSGGRARSGEPCAVDTYNPIVREARARRAAAERDRMSGRSRPRKRRCPPRDRSIEGCAR